MKTFHASALLPALWLCGVTMNRGETTPPPAPHVWMYCTPKCRPCYRGSAEVKGHPDYDFHVRYETPKWVQNILDKNKDLPPAQRKGFPFTIWYGKDGKTTYYESGWEDFETWEAAYRRTM